jgi:type I restriction enzyme, S subunit
VKNGWPSKALMSVCQIKPPKSEARQRISPAQLVSFLPMEDLAIDRKFVSATQARPLSAVAGSYTYFADGDVLLAKITPCFENGKLAIAKKLTNGIGFGSSEYIVFRPNRTLSNEWLYYYLSRKRFRVEGAAQMTGAVGHKRVPKEFIESYLIPVPPLSEQQRIVGILDEASEAIASAKATAEKNLQNARALFESRLESVFTQRGPAWVEKSLETVASILNGYAFKSTDFSAKAGVKCIKITNVGVREFVCSSDAYLPDRFAEEYDTVSVKKGSIVLALTRTIIAGGLKVAVVPDEYDGALLNQRVASITTNDKHLSGTFVFAFLSTKRAVDYVMERVNTLMQPNLSIADLRSMPIPVAPRREQDQITEQLDGLREETQRLTRLYQRKLTALEALKESLLHEAFSGEL